MKLAILAMTCIIGLTACKQEHQVAAIPEPFEEVKQITITSMDLLKDFKKTDAYVAEKYGDVQILNVTGKVHNVLIDSVGNPIIKFETMDELGFDAPLAVIDEAYASSASTIEKGDTVTVVCTVLQSAMGSPLLRGCGV